MKTHISNKSQKASVLHRLLSFDKKLIFAAGVIACVLVNVVLSPISLRIDLSQNRAYSLSPSTEKVIRNVKQDVTIKFYVSSDLPSRLSPVKTDVVDLLSEYKKENSRLRVEYPDPKKDEKIATEAKQYGIPELQFSQVDRDKYAVSTAYFGIAIVAGQKHETIAQVTDTANLEYNITSALYKLTRSESTKIAIVGRDDSTNPEGDSLSTIKSLLSQQYTVEHLDISTESAVLKIDPSYKAVLLIDDGKKSYSQPQLQLFQEYLKNGGGIIVMADGVNVTDSLTTQKAQHGLFSFLKSYGIVLHENLVLSYNAELVNFGAADSNYISAYPLWVKTSVFNKKASYFSNITALTFPWTGSLTTEKVKGYEVRELVKTSIRSWEQKDSFTLTPQTITQPSPAQLQEFLIGAESVGKNGSKIIVIPSSHFVLERYLSRASDNVDLILNMANDLASGGALSGIRTRSPGVYPLPDMPDQQKDIFKYATILVVPLLFGLLGAYRIVRRK